MTYSNAQDISRALANDKTQAAKWLRAMCKSTGRLSTFIIMRYGDPRQWSSLPTLKDNRMRSKRKPRTDKTALKIAEEVFAANGQAAVALRRRVRFHTKKGTSAKWALTYVIKKAGDPREWREVTKNLRSKKARRELSVARECVLEHIDGRVIKANSIVHFCERAGIPDSKYHISPILDGKRVTHKGWYLPETLARKIELRDIYDNVSTHTVRELLVEHKLGKNTVGALLDGRKKTVMNSRLALADTPIDAKVRPNPIKTTRVTLTKGNRTFTGKTICEAARAAGVTSLPNIYKAAYGFREEAQGVRVKSVEVERRSVLNHG